MVEYYIDESYHRQRFETFLQHFVLSKKHIQTILKDHLASVDGVVLSSDSLLFQGQTVTFDLQQWQTPSFPVQHLPIEILYEDQDILVVNKPRGLIIYPDHPTGTNTLVNAILGYYQKKGIPGPVRYLHRLDQDTTGCFLVAKHLLAHSYYTSIWDHDQVKRWYLAKVEGKLIESSMTLDFPIARDRHRQNAYRVSTTGKAAQTAFKVLKREKNSTLIQCHLVTGRPHQIRVHLAHIGHPILGDFWYGSKSTDPLCLHSYEVRFKAIFSSDFITVTAPIPSHFKE